MALSSKASANKESSIGSVPVPESDSISHMVTRVDVPSPSLYEQIRPRLSRLARPYLSSARRALPRPDVSVVMPVHNSGRFLMESLASIQAQSARSIEIICIDDGSTDSSAAVLRQFSKRDSRIRVLRNPTNEGAARARNRGLKAARGRFVRFVDSDDILPQDSTRALLDRALQTRADMVAGAIAVFEGEAGSQLLRVDDIPDRIHTELRNERDLWIPWWFTTYLFSRDFLRRHHLLFPQLVIGEEAIFLTKALTQSSNVSLISDCVYLYRLRTKHSGSGGRSLPYLRSWLQSVEAVKALLLAHHPPAWDEVYGPFTKNQAGSWLLFLESPANPHWAVSGPEVKVLNHEIPRIWGSTADLTQIRSESWWPRDWTRPSVRPRWSDRSP